MRIEYIRESDDLSKEYKINIETEWTDFVVLILIITAINYQEIITLIGV